MFNSNYHGAFKTIGPTFILMLCLGAASGWTQPSPPEASPSPTASPTPAPGSGPSRHIPVWPFVYATVGVLVSVLLPIAREWSKGPGAAETGGAAGFTLSPLAKKLLGLGAFSLLGALVVVALAGGGAANWAFHEAFLAGYSIDSTLQKLQL